MGYFFVIPLWFAILMNGLRSDDAPDVFGYTQTKSGRYVTSVNAKMYFDFDTLQNSGWRLDTTALPADSFAAPVMVNTVTPK